MWQPIETAPRDGTEIIVCKAGIPHEVDVARWFADGEGGWWLIRLGPREPTHWMPIPPVPEACA